MFLALIFEAIFIFYIIAGGGLAFFLLKKKHRISFFLLTVSVLGLFYSAFVEPYWPTVRRQTVQIGKLAQPVKIALLSDFHLRPLKRESYVKRVAEKIRKEKPDLILIAGDFLFFDSAGSFKNDFSAFRNLAEIAPVYAVLGNHEYGLGNRRATITFVDQHEKIKQMLEEAGVRVLIDEKESVKIKDEEFWLAGFKEFWHKEKNPARAAENLADDPRLKIGLSHNPDAAFIPEAKSFDIILAGHTHGGQVRLPWLGALGDAETDLARKNYGDYLSDARPRIFNTVGVGESGPPVRFWNRPEIAVLEIK